MILRLLKMHEIDVDAHAKLIYESRQNSPLRDDERTVEGIKQTLAELQRQEDTHAMVIAVDEGKGDLLGQLMMWLEWGEIGVASQWQPIVHPSVNQEAVATALIEHAKSLVETHSKTKLEVWMEISSNQLKSLLPIYEDWYQQCGFKLNSDEYYMDIEYSKLRELEHSLPEDIEVIPMSKFTNKQLEDVVFETFRASADEWVKSMSDPQLNGSVQGWLKRDETFDPEASIVFKRDGAIIGYNVMRIEGDAIEVGPVGVFPAYRGKGIGRSLILESIHRIPEDQYRVWLTVSTGNTSAYNLYSHLGFENRYTILIYSWAP
ncbi:MAG: GNAT family N-acetyltransferase [Candidatus Thorarchaeota archaeon]